VISSDGWLQGVEHCASANANQRPLGQEINLLVIHNISLPPGEFGTECVAAFFCNQLDPSHHPYFASISALKVSAHLLIDRTGKVTQFVPFLARAWHAGESIFNGIENCNDYSIGIELEGCDHIPYTDAQYEALATVTRQLMVAYPKITLARLVGHCDIAPLRKTDPGSAFDWPRYRATVIPAGNLRR
jgi:N-acetyl-anhydromuramoyl-L-alanine amidase